MIRILANLIGVALALVNWFIRYRSRCRDRMFSWGVWISLVVLLLLFNGWKAWKTVYRYHVGVSDRRP